MKKLFSFIILLGCVSWCLAKNEASFFAQAVEQGNLAVVEHELNAVSSPDLGAALGVAAFKENLAMVLLLLTKISIIEQGDLNAALSTVPDRSPVAVALKNHGAVRPIRLGALPRSPAYYNLSEQLPTEQLPRRVRQATATSTYRNLLPALNATADLS